MSTNQCQVNNATHVGQDSGHVSRSAHVHEEQAEVTDAVLATVAHDETSDGDNHALHCKKQCALLGLVGEPCEEEARDSLLVQSKPHAMRRHEKEFGRTAAT